MLLMFQLSLLVAFETTSSDGFAIAVLHWQQFWQMTIALQSYVRIQERQSQRLWAHERGLHLPRFFDQNLLGSFNARELKGRMRIDVSTFEYLCKPSLRYYKGKTRQCGWSFRFKSKLPYL